MSDNLEDPIEAAIAESLRRSESAVAGDVMLWCVLLTKALESKGPGLAMQWLIDCTQALIEQHPTSYRERLLGNIESLKCEEMKTKTLEQIGESAVAIWYHPPGRDDAQTAVSKLYESYWIHRFHSHRLFIPTFTSPVHVLIFRFEKHTWTEETKSRRKVIYDLFKQLMSHDPSDKQN
jgi:hypothetical protein